MALNGIIQKTGASNGVGILKYDSDTKCILYYRDPDSRLDHSAGTSVQFNIRTVTVTITNVDETTFTSDEDIAILVRIEDGKEVEEIDPTFEQAGGLISCLRSNSDGGDDPPRAGVPAGEAFDYKYGRLVEEDEDGVDQFYYFDRADYPDIRKTPDRPYYATRSSKFIDVDQKLGGSAGTTTIELFAKDITTKG